MKLVAALILSSITIAVSAATPDHPVRIGLAGNDLDACLSLGEVRGLSPREDNFLAVRAGPDPRASMKARLGPGRRFNVCEEAGAWLGIVYDPAPEGDRDCGVGSPVSTPRPYRGPCASGWVSARYVKIIAG